MAPIRYDHRKLAFLQQKKTRRLKKKRNSLYAGGANSDLNTGQQSDDDCGGFLGSSGRTNATNVQVYDKDKTNPRKVVFRRRASNRRGTIIMQQLDSDDYPTKKTKRKNEFEELDFQAPHRVRFDNQMIDDDYDDDYDSDPLGNIMDQLEEKQMKRQKERMGEEIEDIKERMAKILDDYGLKSEDEEEFDIRTLTNPDAFKPKGSELDAIRCDVDNILDVYAIVCQEREEILSDLYESLDTDEIVENYQFSSSEYDDVSSEMTMTIENNSQKGSKLNKLFQKVVILANGENLNPNGASRIEIKQTSRKADLARKVVDQFKKNHVINRVRKEKAETWKHAATEIVDLLKSVRQEGATDFERLEREFQRLVDALQAQTQIADEHLNTIESQKQILKHTEAKKEKVKRENMLLQDEFDRSRTKVKTLQLKCDKLEEQVKLVNGKKEQMVEEIMQQAMADKVDDKTDNIKPDIHFKIIEKVAVLEKQVKKYENELKEERRRNKQLETSQNVKSVIAQKSSSPPISNNVPSDSEQQNKNLAGGKMKVSASSSSKVEQECEQCKIYQVSLVDFEREREAAIKEKHEVERELRVLNEKIISLEVERNRNVVISMDKVDGLTEDQIIAVVSNPGAVSVEQANLGESNEIINGQHLPSENVTNNQDMLSTSSDLEPVSISKKMLGDENLEEISDVGLDSKSVRHISTQADLIVETVREDFNPVTYQEENDLRKDGSCKTVTFDISNMRKKIFAFIKFAEGSNKPEDEIQRHDRFEENKTYNTPEPADRPPLKTNANDSEIVNENTEKHDALFKLPMLRNGFQEDHFHEEEESEKTGKNYEKKSDLQQNVDNSPAIKVGLQRDVQDLQSRQENMQKSRDDSHRNQYTLQAGKDKLQEMGADISSQNVNQENLNDIENDLKVNPDISQDGIQGMEDIPQISQEGLQRSWTESGFFDNSVVQVDHENKKSSGWDKIKRDKSSHVLRFLSSIAQKKCSHMKDATRLLKTEHLTKEQTITAELNEFAQHAIDILDIISFAVERLNVVQFPPANFGKDNLLSTRKPTWQNYDPMTNASASENRKVQFDKDHKKKSKTFFFPDISTTESQTPKTYESDSYRSLQKPKPTHNVDEAKHEHRTSAKPRIQVSARFNKVAEKKRQRLLERHKKLVDRLRASGVGMKQIYTILGIQQRPTDEEIEENENFLAPDIKVTDRQRQENGRISLIGHAYNNPVHVMSPMVRKEYRTEFNMKPKAAALKPAQFGIDVRGPHVKKVTTLDARRRNTTVFPPLNTKNSRNQPIGLSKFFNTKPLNSFR